MLEDCASIYAAENSGTTLFNHQSSCEKILRNMANDSSILKETDNESVKVVCPVAMLERYFSLAGLSHSSKLRLFRGIVHTKKGGRLRASGSLSYTRMRELLLAKLSSLGFNAKSFGVHSLRSGGATAAANAGVPDRLFSNATVVGGQSLQKMGTLRILFPPCCQSPDGLACDWLYPCPFFVTLLSLF